MSTLENIDCFIDGGAILHKYGGIGVYFSHKNEKYKYNNISASLYTVQKKYKFNLIYTNQRAELCALYTALVELKDYLKYGNIVKIYSDSMYTINIFTNWIYKWYNNGWKLANGDSVKNLDILEKLYKFTIYKNQISFEHVRSHQKKPNKDSKDYYKWYGNNIADEFATNGIELNKKQINS